MQKITPFLWFDKEAGEAAKFYTSVFKGKIKNKSIFTDTPSGTIEIYTIAILGQEFTLMSAGPLFKLNPSVSFFLNFDPSKDKNARKNLDALWKKLVQGGTALMPLQKYPFSERYGWVQDKYGVSWQLILSNPGGEKRPFIVPSLMFVGKVCGKAEEATNFYMSVFKSSKRGLVARYPKDMKPDKEGTIMFTDFMINNQWFAAMDSAWMHKFKFSEATSFIVDCKNQKEVDYYWKKLSADKKSEQCGWLKDKYGLSWQIIPSALNELIGKDKSGRVMQAMLKMKKIDIKKLKQAYEQK